MSAARTHPSKRARPSLEHDYSPLNGSSSALPLRDLEHHPEFWFDDGNIILVALPRPPCGTVDHLCRHVCSRKLHPAGSSRGMSSRPSHRLFLDLAHLLRVHTPHLPRSMCCILWIRQCARFLTTKIFLSYRTAEPQVVHTSDEIFSVVWLAHKYHI